MRNTISIAFMIVLVPVGCSKARPNLRPDGSTAPGGSGSGASAAQSCSTPGATQSCCGTGTQTCAGSEFPTWSPCLAADGTVLTCPVQSDCASGEFSSCDGGMSIPPGGCAPGEFGPGCDGGTMPPMVCGPGMVCRPEAIRYCDIPATATTEWSRSVCAANGTWGPCLAVNAPVGAESFGCSQLNGPGGGYAPEKCCGPLKICCQDNPGGPFVDFGSGACAAISCTP